MNLRFFPAVLVVCAGLIQGTPALAQETNLLLNPPVTDNVAQTIANSLLQIQAQLNAAQLALADLQSNRQFTAEVVQSNAAVITARIQTLEQNLATERVRQIALAQKTQHQMYGVIGAAGVLILAAVLLLGYLQWLAVRRMVTRLVVRPMDLPPGSGNQAVEESKARLFGTVDLLEKKVSSLEQLAARPLDAAPAANGHRPAAKSERAGRIASLLADGQTLLNGNKPEQAIMLFNEVLSLEPAHPEALVKKGGALEKLDRLDEAIACYDQAIATDNSLTVAFLQKGALFNRMARYDEALQCYEQALQTQESKKAAGVS